MVRKTMVALVLALGVALLMPGEFGGTSQAFARGSKAGRSKGRRVKGGKAHHMHKKMTPKKRNSFAGKRKSTSKKSAAKTNGNARQELQKLDKQLDNFLAQNQRRPHRHHHHHHKGNSARRELQMLEQQIDNDVARLPRRHHHHHHHHRSSAMADLRMLDRELNGFLAKPGKNTAARKELQAIDQQLNNFLKKK